MTRAVDREQYLRLVGHLWSAVQTYRDGDPLIISSTGVLEGGTIQKDQALPGDKRCIVAHGGETIAIQKKPMPLLIEVFELAEAELLDTSDSDELLAELRENLRDLRIIEAALEHFGTAEDNEERARRFVTEGTVKAEAGISFKPVDDFSRFPEIVTMAQTLCTKIGFRGIEGMEVAEAVAEGIVAEHSLVKGDVIDAKYLNRVIEGALSTLAFVAGGVSQIAGIMNQALTDDRAGILNFSETKRTR